MTRTRVAVFAAATAIGLISLTACGGKANTAASAPVAQGQQAVALSTTTAGDLGTVVTDKDGMTLYRFDKDTAEPSVSNCDGDCATAWPPAVVTSDDIQVKDVDKALVGTIDRKDGSKQLTLANWPLYRFALTTHYMDEANALADRVVVLARGRIIAEGAPGELGRGASRGHRELPDAGETRCASGPPHRRATSRRRSPRRRARRGARGAVDRPGRRSRTSTSS